MDLLNLLRIAILAGRITCSAMHGRSIMCYGEPEMLPLYTPRLRENEDEKAKGQGDGRAENIGIYVSPDGITKHYIGSYALLYDTH
jgi:hypothetical protein